MNDKTLEELKAEIDEAIDKLWSDQEAEGLFDETLLETHPEDAIHKAATFIKELGNVQTTYYEQLVDNLPPLTTRGEDFLYDYVFNQFDQSDYEDFADYFMSLGITAGQIYES